MIIDHDYPPYREIWSGSGQNKWNGAFFYSKEIVKNIIPNVKTDRNWLTINTRGYCLNNSIVFIHNNKYPENYEWLKKYQNLILVCGIETTVKKVARFGKAIYLPLSVDVADVEKYKAPKTKKVAFAGRPEKATWAVGNCDRLQGIPRTELLKAMAQYEQVYAVGRVAIEAKILGCKVLPYDPRFPDPSIWKILDNRDAAKMLQKEIDKIDGKKM